MSLRWSDSCMIITIRWDEKNIVEKFEQRGTGSDGCPGHAERE